MHILLLTRVDETQMARLRELIASKPGTLLSRDKNAAAAAPQKVSAIIGAPTPEVIEHLHQVEWVQLRTDTLESWGECIRTLHDRGIKVTRTRGSYDDTVPDHAMMLVLALARDLPRLLGQRLLREWQPAELEPVVLSGSTLLLVGLGSIGCRIADRAAAFGMRILAVDPAPLEIPEAVRKVYAPDQLPKIIGDADFIVAAVPLNESSAGMLGAEALARVKQTAVLVNVGRGGVVDTDALLAALDEGRLAGAGLDVAEPWPLPPDHPLFDHPRVILTGHSAQRGSDFVNRQFEVIHENLRRYLAGEPLLNIVPPADS